MEQCVSILDGSNEWSRTMAHIPVHKGDYINVIINGVASPLEVDFVSFEINEKRQEVIQYINVSGYIYG